MDEVELRSLLVDRESGTPTSRIVSVLRERGTLTATQIARLTGLAKSTVSTALSELRRSEVVVEIGTESAGSVGRPATALTLNPRAGTCIGILVGLSEIQVIVADVAHAVLADRIVHLEPDYEPGVVLGLVRKMVAEAYEEAGRSEDGLLGVGIAMGAPVNPATGTVVRAGGLPNWAGVDVREMFEPMFTVPIFADNESNCAAIAEMTWGAAQGYDDFILFTLAAGVGGAIVSGGKVLRGIAGGAGEFGHIVIDPDGPLCRCGNRGCLEVFASLRGPLAEAERHFGRPVRIADIVAQAQAGDATCLGVIQRAAELGGRGLGIIGSVFNPPLIIISGGLERAGNLLMEPLAASFERYTLVKHSDVPDSTRTILRPSRFTDNGACMGAVGLVLRHHGRLH